MALERRPARNRGRRLRAPRTVSLAATQLAGEERFAPARSPRACATWLLQRPCKRWPGTRQSVSASWSPRATRSRTTSKSRATARPFRATSRSPNASSETTPRRCSSSTRSARRARRSNPPTSRAPTSRNSGSTSRPTPGPAPSWRGRSSCAACGRTPPTSRSTATGWARRSPSSRPEARPGTMRSRWSFRCAACRCPWFAWSWRRRRSFARIPSTCRPRRAPRRGSAPPAGSPPSSPPHASARARPASRMGKARTPGPVPWRLFVS